MRNRCGCCLVFFFCLLVLLLGSGLTARAQNFDFAKDRAPMVALKGLWRFHTGDNPAWAKPGFDDSHWTLLKSDEGWGEQGYKHYSGIAWYRFTVTLPAKHGPMALYLPKIIDSYQVFADGVLIGHAGSLPPHPVSVQYIPQAVSIPAQMTPGAATVHFAIRVWASPLSMKFSYQGGSTGVTWIGSADAIQRLASLETKHVFWANADVLIEGLAYLGVGLGALGLFLLGPGEREYLWFGLSQIFSAAGSAEALALFYYRIPREVDAVVGGTFNVLGAVFLLLFVYVFLRRRFDRLFWVALGLTALGLAEGLSLVTYTHPIWSVVTLTVEWIGMAGFYILFQLVLYLEARRGSRDAWLLFAAFGSSLLWLALQTELIVVVLLGLPYSHTLLHFLESLAVNWPFPMRAGDLVNVIVEFALLGILVMRFARTRKDEQRLAGELEAARSVQQVLVPEVIPQTPGYEIEAAYRPAQEVGGDFFQIVRRDDGGLLAVIGDVSGKGVGAGMTVSLLVGTFRALAEYEDRPARLLQAINERMVGRTGGGFTTCMILRATADGRVVMANAGHLHPYVDGREVEVQGGLPLGLAAEVEYSETTLELADGSRLTLLTDGVVEARDLKTGELLGFDRTRELVGQTAEAIVTAAQRFGQEDDITVLTLVRRAEAKTTAAEAVEPVLSPA